METRGSRRKMKIGRLSFSDTEDYQEQDKMIFKRDP